MARLEIIVNLIDNASAGMAGLTGSAMTLSGALGAAGVAAMGIGAGLTAGITVPAAAATGAAAKLAGDFEQDMLKIRALTGATKEDTAAVAAEIPKIARETGRSVKELSEAYYFVASSGFKSAADAMPILEASARAAASGLGETKDVADVVTSTLAAYKKGGEEASWATDVLVQAVLEGKAEADQFAGSIGRVLPIASALGVSFEEVTASMAIMTRVGLNADESATALRGTLNTFEKPSKMVQDNLAAIGLTADGMRQSIRERGLLATLDDLMKRTEGTITLTSVQSANWEKVAKDTKDYTARVDDLNVKLGQQTSQLALLESNLGKTSTGKQASAQQTRQQELAISKLRDQIAQTNGAITEYNGKLVALGNTQDTVTTKQISGEEILGRIIPNVRALTGVLATAKSQGDEYARALESIKGAQGAANQAFAVTAEGANFQWRRLMAALESVGITLGAKLLPFITPLVQKLANELPPAIDKLLARWNALDDSTKKFLVGIALVAVALGPALMVLGGLAVAISFILSPIGLVTLAVVALGALIAGFAVAWATNFMGIRERASEAWLVVRNGVADVMTWFANLSTQILQKVMPAINGIWNFLTRFLLPIFRGLADVVGAVAMKALDTAHAFITQKFIPALRDLHNWFDVHILPTLKTVADWLGDKLGKASEVARGFIEKLSGALEKLYDWAKKAEEFLHKVAKAIRDMPTPNFSMPGGSSGSGGPDTGTSNYDNSQNSVYVNVSGSDASPAEIAQAVSDAQWGGP